MYKILLIGLVFFAGCAKMDYSAPICDKIELEPNVVVPQECRKYSEAKATKAFNKTKEAKKESDKEIIEFHQEKKKVV